MKSPAHSILDSFDFSIPDTEGSSSRAEPRSTRRPNGAEREQAGTDDRSRAGFLTAREVYRTTFKRLFDVVGASSLIVVTSPLMVASALAVKATSPGPVVFRQRRLTLGGREFVLMKFRTMREDAERGSGPVFAGERDPRVTPVGRFMRKTRLDELPQLFNVIKGEMSLIGPRPERPEIAAQLKETITRFDKRLGAKAGVTGLAQVVQGYPDGVDGYRKKLAWDVVYIQKQSFVLDLWIAIRTVGVVLTGSGAR